MPIELVPTHQIASRYIDRHLNPIGILLGWDCLILLTALGDIQ
jgi:hypothetical protein